MQRLYAGQSPVGAPIPEVVESTFETEVLRAPGLVLVIFWAPWNGTSKRLTAILEEVAFDNIDNVKIVKVNVAESVELDRSLHLVAMPTMMFFYFGGKVAELLGLHHKADIQKQIDQLLAIGEGPPV